MTIQTEVKELLQELVEEDKKYGYKLKPNEVTARIYADAVGITHKNASYRLEQKAQKGELKVKKEIIDGRETNVYYK